MSSVTFTHMPHTVENHYVYMHSFIESLKNKTKQCFVSWWQGESQTTLGCLIDSNVSTSTP